MSLDPVHSGENAGQYELVSMLARHGIEAIFVSSADDVPTPGARHDPSSRPLALMDTAYLTSAELRRCVQECVGKDVPVIALIPRRQVSDLDDSLRISDFIVAPPDADELVIRARRALRDEGVEQDVAVGLIRIGDLVIDPTSYEVTIGGQRIGLRFKEYELLRVLAESPGRVFNRETLLSLVWGYDYFGGTRTVDVHIRRLRSKIELSERTSIETIWNVGYRFNET